MCVCVCVCVIQALATLDAGVLRCVQEMDEHLYSDEVRPCVCVCVFVCMCMCVSVCVLPCSCCVLFGLLRDCTLLMPMANVSHRHGPLTTCVCMCVCVSMAMHTDRHEVVSPPSGGPQTVRWTTSD